MKFDSHLPCPRRTPKSAPAPLPRHFGTDVSLDAAATAQPPNLRMTASPAVPGLFANTVKSAPPPGGKPA